MFQILIALAAGPGQFQADTSYLYRTLLLRAAPGELLAVIDLYQQHRPTYAASGDGAPFIARHRQGDHWDLMLIFPMGSFAAYYAPDRITRGRRRSKRSRHGSRTGSHGAKRCS